MYYCLFCHLISEYDSNRYQYISKQASVEEIQKLNRKKNLKFTQEKLAMQLQKHIADKDKLPEDDLKYPIASQLINKSEYIIEYY